MSLVKSFARTLYRLRGQRTVSRRPARPGSLVRRLELENLEDRTLLDVGLLLDAPFGNRNATAGFVGNQAETTVAVNPNNVQQIFAASNPAVPGLMVWRWSNNAGGTWNNSSVAGLPLSVGENQATWDRYGNLFVTYLGGAGVVVARSINGGQTWQLIANFGGVGVAEPSIDTGPGAPGSGFSGSVWVTYRDTGAPDHIVARGAGISGLGLPAAPAFTVAQRAPSSNQGNFGDIAITNLGAVLVTYQTPATGLGPSTIRTNTDSNGIISGGFSAAVTASTTNVGGSVPIPAQPSRAIDAEANLDCHHSSNACYLVYVDRRMFDADTNIFLRTSFTAGASWNAPFKVNDDVGANSQFNPALDVDQTTGDVVITWLDARNAGAANNTVQVWGTVRFFGSANNWFWPNHRLSNGIFSRCDTASSFNCGGYDTGAFHNGLAYRSWADNSLPSGLTPANANFPPNSQDMAVGRLRIDNADAGCTLATALNTGMGPWPTTFFHLTEPIGNDNRPDGTGNGLRDVDLYRFTAHAGTTVTARTHLPTGGVNLNTALRLFNGAGAQLATNDDDEPATDRYSRLTFTIATAGTYYLGVSSFANGNYNPNVCGSGNNGPVGDYRLDLSLTGQPDIGDTVANALSTGIGPLVGSYTLPSEVIGNGTYNRRDVDFYRFQATPGQKVTIKTTLPPNGDSGDTILTLFNNAPVPVRLIHNDDYEPNCPTDFLYSCIKDFVLPPSPGNIYYVAVSAYRNFDSSLIPGGYIPTIGGMGLTTTEIDRLGDYSFHLSLSHGPAAFLQLTQSTQATEAGEPFSVTVRALDLAGNIDADYNSTVTFSSSDLSATLPPSSRLPGGVRTFPNGVTLYVAGNQTVTVGPVDNPNIRSDTVNHTVIPGRVASFYIYPGSDLATSVTQGVPFDIYVFPFDQYFNWVTTYVGTVTFLTLDPLGVVPPDYSFKGSGGFGVPGSLMLGTLGVQALFVWDTANVTVYGYAEYNVLAPGGSPRGGSPGGGSSGGRQPGAGHAADLPMVPRPGLPPFDGRVTGAGHAADLPVVPILDRPTLEQLFARHNGQTVQEAVHQLVRPRQTAPVLDRMSAVFGEELFQTL